METASFSEFSYGYAITDNILHTGFPHTSHAPHFPSLLAEGSTGGGYDVRIPLYPVAVFIQFKIPQVVRRSSANMPPSFTTPYLRMHLRTKRPNQHQLLLALEETGQQVFYATPDFHTATALDEHFSHQRVHNRSWYIRPSAIGILDGNPHCIAYRLGDPQAWRCSVPTLMPGKFGSEDFALNIDRAVQEAERQEPVRFLNQLARNISVVTERRMPNFFSREETIRQYQQNDVPKRDTGSEAAERREARRLRATARELSYLSQVRLGCTLVITGHD